MCSIAAGLRSRSSTVACIASATDAKKMRPKPFSRVSGEILSSAEKIVKLIEHDPRADAHTASFEIQIADLPVIARELNDQAFANRVADQTRARAARRHRKPRISRCADYQTRLLCAFRKCDPNRLD